MENGEAKEQGNVLINTELNFNEKTKAPEHLFELRTQIRERFKSVFDELPEVQRGYFKITKYIKENPQTVMFVSEKDINMFPLILNEAKTFLKSYESKNNKEKYLNQVGKHEFEHVQKIYELGLDFKGMGLILMKHKGKPVFGGFAVHAEDKDTYPMDTVRVKLAPRTLAFRNTDDIISSERLLLQAFAQSKNFEDINRFMSDSFFVFSERYFPKKIHNFLQNITSNTDDIKP